MKTATLLVAMILSVSAFLLPAQASAGTDQETKILAATEIINNSLAARADAIPSSILEKAHGVIVIPNVFEIAVGSGGYSSNGVMVVRTEDGRWSSPAFVTLTGTSLKTVSGTKPTDIILLLMGSNSVDAVSSRKTTLGIDMAAAPGPVGAGSEKGARQDLSAEILVYKHSKAEIGGIMMEGDSLEIDSRANADFYGEESITAAAIFEEGELVVPIAAGKFKCALARLTQTGQACV